MQQFMLEYFRQKNAGFYDRVKVREEEKGQKGVFAFGKVLFPTRTPIWIFSVVFGFIFVLLIIVVGVAQFTLEKSAQNFQANVFGNQYSSVVELEDGTSETLYLSISKNPIQNSMTVYPDRVDCYYYDKENMKYVQVLSCSAYINVGWKQATVHFEKGYQPLEKIKVKIVDDYSIKVIPALYAKAPDAELWNKTISKKCTD